MIPSSSIAEPAAPVLAARAPEVVAPPRASIVPILVGHTAFTILFTILYVNALWLVPMLVRLQFGSRDPNVQDLQTTLVTAAVPTFMIFSIFWNTLLRRLPLRRYLFVYWVVAVLPIGLMALVQNYWQLLALHVVATAGQGSWTPLNGKLLKHFYADHVRGRAYAILNAAGLVASILSVWGLGHWMRASPGAFRWYFPCAAVLQFGGLFILVHLARRTGTPDEPVQPGPGFWTNALAPLLHMGAVLRGDRMFARYETAFMTYGAAFMICDALLPIYATAKLGMGYDDYAHSTQFIARIVMLVATLPMGWTHDRIGPVRTSCLAFGTLVAYPLLVWRANGFTGLALASIPWGLGLAAVQMGWMLGPVILARTPERVPQYVAIHATLVGFRGVIFQGLGVLIYKLSGSFTFPLLLASALFAHAAWQMWRLHGTVRAAAKAQAGVTAN